MLAVQSRSGAGQDFEFEFGEYGSGSDTFLRVRPSSSFAITRFYPDRAGSETHLRWMSFRGENRLVIDITGMAKMPFDDAPEDLRKALLPWVEKFANHLRKHRYQD